MAETGNGNAKFDLEERTARFGEAVIAFVKRIPGNAITTPLIGQIVRSSRSEEHTSELQSQSNLVCRLLLEKKKHSSFGRGFRPFPSSIDDQNICGLRCSLLRVNTCCAHSQSHLHRGSCLIVPIDESSEHVI